jgi:hypothetical protein
MSVAQMPSPTVRATRIEEDFKLSGKLSEAVWERAVPASIDYQTADATARPELATPVRILWSDKYLYLGYEAPYTQLTTFEPPQFDKKRLGLWDRDVVEAFIGVDPAQPNFYSEYEVAPTGERLDLLLRLPERDFEWNSGWETAVSIDQGKQVWRVEMRIPLASLSPTLPTPGTRWRLNLYRCDRAHDAFLAWNPTLTQSFHTPERFGWLQF